MCHIRKLSFQERRSQTYNPLEIFIIKRYTLELKADRIIL